MDPLMATIQLFAGNFAPRGWAFCDGQLLAISQYEALFSLLGTTYGGDGRTSFALPDLRGRVPVGQGQGPGLSDYPLGRRSGVETVTLSQLELPSHTHATQNVPSADQSVLLSTEDAVNEIPDAGDVPAIANYANGLATERVKSFGPPATGKVVEGQKLSGNAGLVIANNGGSQSHNNVQPYLALNYIIAMVGLYPSRS